jgi:nucleoside-diphosphate-sugar epimerase
MKLNPVIASDLNELVIDPELFQGFRNTRILITGAAGFLPSYFVHLLLYLNQTQAWNCRVDAVVRNIEKAQKCFACWQHVWGSELMFRVSDLSSLPAELPVADWILHAASPASPVKFMADPMGTVNANINGTALLLEKAKTDGAKGFLLFSSSEVYGDCGEGESFVSEEHLGFIDFLGPRSVYPEAKRMAECLCAGVVHHSELPVKIARIFHTYGPGLLPDDGRVFADFIHRAARGFPIEIKSDGSGKRAFCYITDTIRALTQILFKGQFGQPYNVGNPDAIVSVRELANLMVQLPESRTLEVIFAPVTTVQSASSAVFPNVNRLKQLGWHPQVSLTEGFSRSIKSVQYEHSQNA